MAAFKPILPAPTDSPMGAVQDQSSSAPAHVTLPPLSSVNATRKPNILDVAHSERNHIRPMHLVENLHPSTIQEALDETNYYLQVELGYNFKDPLDLRYDGSSLELCGKTTRARDQIRPTSYTGRIMLNIGIVKSCPIIHLLDRITRQLLIGVAEHIGEADLIGRCAYQLQTPYTHEVTEKALYDGPPGDWKRRPETPGLWYLTLVRA
ncbi:hypothetical protein HII31_09560 [Pseudocercospora fuligena]|uniref:Uncharacterized protein n=1 Tax=Pseudocercospora fuligena TaxID=685502 RepID=A0A8H6RDL8_9PEZI|nr:hypothetical protein HII31_09560 [Pseudocercospora fuligena]